MIDVLGSLQFMYHGVLSYFSFFSGFWILNFLEGLVVDYEGCKRYCQNQAFGIGGLGERVL